MFTSSTRAAASIHLALFSSVLTSLHQTNPFPVTQLHVSPRSQEWMVLEVKKGRSPVFCSCPDGALRIVKRGHLKPFSWGGGLERCSSCCEEDLGKSTRIKASQCLSCHAQLSGQLWHLLFPLIFLFLSQDSVCVLVLAFCGFVWHCQDWAGSQLQLVEFNT